MSQPPEQNKTFRSSLSIRGQGGNTVSPSYNAQQASGTQGGAWAGGTNHGVQANGTQGVAGPGLANTTQNNTTSSSFNHPSGVQYPGNTDRPSGSLLNRANHPSGVQYPGNTNRPSGSLLNRSNPPSGSLTSPNNHPSGSLLNRANHPSGAQYPASTNHPSGVNPGPFNAGIGAVPQPGSAWGPYPATPSAGPRFQSNGSWGEAGPNGQGEPGQRKRKRFNYANLSTRGKILLAVLLIALLIPFITILGEGINAYVLYKQEQSGMQHLTNVQKLFSGAHGHTEVYFDATKLRQAQLEIDAAHNDFQQLRDELDQDGFISLVGGIAPQQITTVRALCHIGVDATEIGQKLVQSALKLSPTLGPALTAPANGTPPTSPIVTPPVFEELRADLNFLVPRMHDIALRSHNISLDALPLKPTQRDLLTTALKIAPVADAALAQAPTMMGAFGWLIGVDGPRTFLVETMDRGELRSTGGFTGQFGELSFNGGRMAPFTLKNIGQFEENHQDQGSPLDPVFNKVVGQAAPSPYTWWRIPNFGLRDANLSADFPTSAKLAMNAYQYEFGKQLDGVVVFSPFLISHVLQVIGPVSVPDYNETITAQNLEQRLHYYQLDNAGIRKEEIVEHVEDPQQARKLFTQKLSKLLLSAVQHAPTDKLLSLANEMFYAMKTKDMQAYFSNDQLEQLIAKYGSTAQMDRSPDHDGLFVVQSNLSVSKAAQYVQTSIQDTVSLDAAGGATHVMRMRLAYTQIGQVYGLDTYRDYVRVYVPTNSQFLWGDGFSQFGHPYCGGAFGACPRDIDLFGNGALLCPPGTNIGEIPALNDDPYGDALRPIDKIGPPPNKTSDEAGRNMYGGWVVVPKNCNMTVTLSWYVPSAGHGAYSLLLQRQSSTFAMLDLTILPTASNCSTLKTSGLHFSGVMGGQDQTFTLPVAKAGGQGGCYPQNKV